MDSHKTIQYQLRLPAELKAWLHEQAKANYRSLNAEILNHLASVKNASNKKADCIRQDNQSASH